MVTVNATVAVLVRVLVVQMYTADDVMCHVMSCKHCSLTGFPARVIVFCINKKIRTFIRCHAYISNVCIL